MYTTTTLTASSTTGRTITLGLYANYDAYAYSYQAITKKSVGLIDNCYYPYSPSGSCYNTLGSSAVGNFYLNKVTDTFMQISFNPTSNQNYGGGGGNHYWEVKFDGFNYGTCSISSIII